MGIEFIHYVAPTDSDWPGDDGLLSRMHEALRSLGLVQADPVVLDFDRPLKSGKPRERGAPSKAKTLPKEAAFLWPALTDPYAAADLFGVSSAADRDQGLFFQPCLHVGPTFKVLGQLGYESWVLLEGEAEDDDAHTSWYRGRGISKVFPADRKPVPKAQKIVLRAGRDEALPEDWFAGVFRCCLVLDFHKTIPGFAVGHGPARLPVEMRGRLEEAFRVPVSQSYAWI